MDRRQRMLAAIRHQETDVVPWTVKFTVEALERLRAHCGAAFDPVLDTGSHAVTAHTNHGWSPAGPERWRDHFGVVWDKSRDRTLGVVVDPPLAERGPDDFAWPDPAACPVYAEAERNRQRFPEHLRMLSIGFSLFERAWSLTGMERLLCLLHEDPALVHALLDRITAWNLEVIRRCAPLGIDAVHLGDDWGSQHGPLFSPKAWRTFIAPRLAATCAEAHRLGLLVSLHCCGNVAPLMEGIAEAGVDVFDPFQPEAMDIAALRHDFRGRLAFWGGLSVQRTLPHGSVDEVRAETRRLLREIAPGGGYILSPSHSISGDVPPENVLAFLDEAAHQGLIGEGQRSLASNGTMSRPTLVSS